MTGAKGYEAHGGRRAVALLGVALWVVAACGDSGGGPGPDAREDVAPADARADVLRDGTVDVAEPEPDAVDVAEPEPDVAEPEPDAADVAEPEPDVTEPEPDVTEPEPDIVDVPEPEPDVPDADGGDAEDGLEELPPLLDVLPDLPEVGSDTPFEDTFVVPDVGEGDAPGDVGGDVGPCGGDADCPSTACLAGACVEGACVFTPVEGVCDDLNPCTQGDVCVAGACAPGPNACAEVCDNGLDDDLDGETDCADAGCLEEAGCALVCGGQEPVSCGSQVFDSRAKVTATAILGDLCGLPADGAEVVYAFEPPPDLVSLTATVGGAAGVEVLAPGQQGVCGGATCLGSGEGGATWEPGADAPGEVFLVVDGPAGTEDAFVLDVACTFPVVEYCSNTVDDDGDGATDCDDPDCEGHPVCGGAIEKCANGVDDDADGDTDCDDSECVGTFDCVPLPGCDTLYDLSCGTTLAGALGEAGSTDHLDAWACGVSGLDGPETAHRFVAPATLQVQVALEGAPAGAQLLVLEDGDACDPDACLAAGEDAVTFEAIEGASYALVVDAPGDVAGTYDLSVACVGGELCANGVDDDGDGLADCYDADCVGEGGCTGQLCTPGEVVECDASYAAPLGAVGAIDATSCGPSGAAGEAVAIFSPDVDVSATFTVSGDAAPSVALLDASGGCDTSACVEGGGPQATVDAPGFSSWAVLVDGAHAGEYELLVNCAGEEALCFDGLDDDGDGLVDCDDADCLGQADCPPACPVDGVVPCGSVPLAPAGGVTSSVVDWGCAGAAGLDGGETAWRLALPAGSAEAVVRATLVGGGPGARVLALGGSAVCDPGACVAASGTAVEVLVAPGEQPYLAVDAPLGGGEGLGLVVNCGGDEDVCWDDVDGDGDGLADCEDPDCAGQVDPCPAVETDCADGQDGDGDQLTDCEDPDCYGVGACPLAPGQCVPAGDLFCDEPVSSGTAGPGSEPGPLELACPDGALEAQQGTITWLFYGLGEEVTARLAEPAGDAAIAVLESPDGTTCDPLQCIGSGAAEVPFFAAEGQAYLVVLLSTGPEAAAAQVEVSCVPPGEGWCDDGQDGDGDGLIDCLDPECAAEPVCELCRVTGHLGCGVTESLTPLAEPGGTRVLDGTCGPASPGPEQVFELGPVDDVDVTVTTVDPDARLHVFLRDPSAPCGASACVAGGASGLTFPTVKEEQYLVAVDTVGDGAAEVAVTVSCVETPEICDDAVDNDQDGDTDCADTDCFELPPCAPDP